MHDNDVSASCVSAKLKRPVLAILKCPLFEGASQHAEPSTTRSRAKAIGRKQPVGTAMRITRLRRAGPRERCAADACVVFHNPSFSLSHTGSGSATASKERSGTGHNQQ